MTHSDAKELVTGYCGQPLLESLERLSETDLDFVPANVVTAYDKLMSGFRHLFLGDS